MNKNRGAGRRPAQGSDPVRVVQLQGGFQQGLMTNPVFINGCIKDYRAAYL